MRHLPIPCNSPTYRTYGYNALPLCVLSLQCQGQQGIGHSFACRSSTPWHRGIPSSPINTWAFPSAHTKKGTAYYSLPSLETCVKTNVLNFNFSKMKGGKNSILIR